MSMMIRICITYPSTGIALALYGLFLAGEIVCLLTKKSVCYKHDRFVRYFAFGGLFLLISIFCQGMLKPYTAISILVTLPFDFLSVFFMLIYIFFRGGPLIRMLFEGHELLNPVIQKPLNGYILAGILAFLTESYLLIVLFVVFLIGTAP